MPYALQNSLYELTFSHLDSHFIWHLRWAQPTKKQITYLKRYSQSWTWEIFYFLSVYINFYRMTFSSAKELLTQKGVGLVSTLQYSVRFVGWGVGAVWSVRRINGVLSREGAFSSEQHQSHHCTLHSQGPHSWLQQHAQWALLMSSSTWTSARQQGSIH